MTAPVHSGNERWQVHCPDPHPDPGCWCYEEWIALRDTLAVRVNEVTPYGFVAALAVADHLLADDNNLRIELR